MKAAKEGEKQVQDQLQDQLRDLVALKQQLKQDSYFNPQELEQAKARLENLNEESQKLVLEQEKVMD